MSSTYSVQTKQHTLEDKKLKVHRLAEHHEIQGDVSYKLFNVSLQKKKNNLTGIILPMPFTHKPKLCFNSIAVVFFIFSSGETALTGLSLVTPTGKEFSPVPFWEFYRMKSIPHFFFSEVKKLQKTITFVITSLRIFQEWKLI